MKETSAPTTLPNTSEPRLDRRSFLKLGLLAAAAGLFGWLFRRNAGVETVWQIDPEKCTACGRCATSCVLAESAVKAVHAYAMCGYCKLCTGFFVPDPLALDEGAENQLCPTGALQRSFVEDPYYQYAIDEKLCIGCGRCVRGCAAFGNGSLFLQIRHDRCLHCHECSIAKVCPPRAIKQVPAAQPYLLKPRPDAADSAAKMEVERID